MRIECDKTNYIIDMDDEGFDGFVVLLPSEIKPFSERLKKLMKTKTYKKLLNEQIKMRREYKKSNKK